MKKIQFIITFIMFILISSMSFTALAQDTTNRPPTIIQKKEIVYPNEALKKGLEGTVLLKVKLSDKGIISDIEIKKSSGYDILDNAAIDCIKTWIFTPAYKDDEEVDSSFITPIMFRLAHSQEQEW